ncbi:hypothetical protein DFH09DRAFT_980432 [Mycena vulgaris]|nr:hypothetical protein DFH09DRAFT_980432 [Mycena vulgaris]
MGSPGDGLPGPGGRLQSPFSRLLCTNTVPSDAECAAIRQFLSGLQKNFAALAGQIAHMQAVLTDLTDQCQSLRESIDAHQALVSLARRLPEDVVREIFLACLPSSGNAVMSAREAPLLLGQVCSSWRRIAFTTPQLWASLHVVVPSLSSLRRMMGAVDAWLSRSGVLPLSITLAVSRACEPGSDNVATMIDVLANFSPRWRRVKITLSPHTILTPLTNLHASDVPMLESIAFSSIGSGTWQNVVAPLEIPWRAFNFLRTPAIRSASISSLGGNLLALPFQWPLLRSLSLTAGNIKDSNSFHLTTTAALLILRQCPNLTTCTICITPDRNTVAGNPDVQPPSLILPHLTDLTVDNREHSQINAVALFGCLRVPVLKRFAYCGPKYQGPLPFNALFSAIHALEDLSIDLKGLTVDAFLHFLELLPSLVQLRLDSGGEYDPWSTPGAQWGRENPLATANDVLRLLTPAPEGSHECLCPLLRRVEVVRCAPLADDVVLNFIQRRSEAEHPLAHIAVTFARQREFDIMPYLQALVADGLRVSLTYLPPPLPPTYSPWEGLEDAA